eukprot:TRINITY_DN27845_c0_g1_i1.p1 TRINITY_DN27845_c0_g1~~TRINITY_DN27845_c0_g1_i1.p1  ORF type:complete len:144 (+),score=36.10 TRINITY_DN27845_c0_g1_i1:202-633(+)
MKGEEPTRSPLRDRPALSPCAQPNETTTAAPLAQAAEQRARHSKVAGLATETSLLREGCGTLGMQVSSLKQDMEGMRDMLRGPPDDVLRSMVDREGEESRLAQAVHTQRKMQELLQSLQQLQARDVQLSVRLAREEGLREAEQ